MSIDQQPMSLRFTGGNTVPVTVRARELANLITAIEDAVVSLAQNNAPNNKREELGLALTGVQDKSLGLLLDTLQPTAIRPSFLVLAKAVASQIFSALPIPTLDGLRAIQSFVKRRDCVAEFRIGDFTTEPIAVITAETRIQGVPRLTGTTTLYGRVTRVGGDEPKARIELSSGEKVSCAVTVDMAKELGRRLYDRVGLTGTAVWNAETWGIDGFTVTQIEGYIDRSPATVVKELRDRFGHYFDEIEDADTFVRSLRDDDAEE